MKNRPFYIRLGFVLAGIRTVWRRERSFRTQTCFAAVAVLALATLRPGFVWTAIIVLAIAGVLALEMLNSSLEYLIDHLHPEIADPIRCAKNAAAGAVLMVSFAALVTGALIASDVLSYR